MSTSNTTNLRHLDNFDKLIQSAVHKGKVDTAVAYPCSEVALQGAVEAAKLGIINPILCGPEPKIKEIAQKVKLDISSYQIVNTPDNERQAAQEAVKLCKEKTCSVLMKGSLHTDNFMGSVVNREQGIRTSNRISHVFIMDVPAYHKLLLVTDGAINIQPDLETKVSIVKNSITLAQAIGIKEPKVALLSAVEQINTKIPNTIEAAAICKMADREQITGAIIDGPLALDNAISEEALNIKKIQSPVKGQADILVAPNLEAGNMIAKELSYLANADSAGIVIGAQVPIILTSRADDAKARIASAAVAALVAHDSR